MLLPKKLREMDAMLPNDPGKIFSRAEADVLPALGARRAKVAMLDGCVMPLLFGDVNEATVRVLRRNGCDVLFPEKANLLRRLEHSQRREPCGQTDGPAQHRCFSRSQRRCDHRQCRRLRRGDERIRLFAARRSGLSRKSRALQRAGQGRRRISRRTRPRRRASTRRYDRDLPRSLPSGARPAHSHASRGSYCKRSPA